MIENYFFGEEGNLITVFTHPECEYSKMLIDDLVELGEDFQNIDLLIDPEFWNSVENVCKGNRMTPITIYEDGSHTIQWCCIKILNLLDLTLVSIKNGKG